MAKKFRSKEKQIVTKNKAKKDLRSLGGRSLLKKVSKLQKIKPGRGQKKG